MHPYYAFDIFITPLFCTTTVKAGILPNSNDPTDEEYTNTHLISGHGDHPQEDVGGVDGYADMLKSLANPNDDEREIHLKWLGQKFNPEFFVLHQPQKRLDDFQRDIGEFRWGVFR